MSCRTDPNNETNRIAVIVSLDRTPNDCALCRMFTKAAVVRVMLIGVAFFQFSFAVFLFAPPFSGVGT